MYGSSLNIHIVYQSGMGLDKGLECHPITCTFLCLVKYIFSIKKLSRLIYELNGTSPSTKLQQYPPFSDNNRHYRRQYSTFFENIQHSLTIFNILQQYLTFSDNNKHFRHYSTFSDNIQHFRHFVTIFDIF